MGWGLAALLSTAIARPGSALAAERPAPSASATTAPKRRRPRYKNLKRPRGPAVIPEILHEAGWRPEVKKALETLVAAKGNASKGYSVDWPPVAVITLDDVAIAHFAGEVAFLRLVERAEFRSTEAWWDRLPAEFRDRARRDYKRFSQRAEATWPQDEDYLDWRKQMFSAYELSCKRDGRRACRGWLTTLLAGYTEGETESYMKETVDEALREPLRMEEIRANAGDEHPVLAPRGLRRVPAVEELVRRLLDAGFDVWTMSSSNQWVAEVLSGLYGVDPSRVVGLRTKVLNQRLQTEIIDPVPIGPGTAEAVTVFIGRDPALVVGDGADVELLEHGKGLRVVLDRGDAAMMARATDRGWLLQEPLPAGEAEAR